MNDNYEDLILNIKKLIHDNIKYKDQDEFTIEFMKILSILSINIIKWGMERKRDEYEIFLAMLESINNAREISLKKRNK